MVRTAPHSAKQHSPPPDLSHRHGERACLLQAPRIVVDQVSPSVDGGRFPVKRLAFQPVEVEADIFMDTHDKLDAQLLWREPGSQLWHAVPMALADNHRWRASFTPSLPGLHLFAVEAWHDRFATYRDGLLKKMRASVDIIIELEEGRLLLERILSQSRQQAENKPGSGDEFLKKAVKALRTPAATEKLLQTTGCTVDPALTTLLQPYAANQQKSLQLLLSAELRDQVRKLDLHEFLARSREYPVRAERKAAAFSSWYEMFPRSQSGDAGRHGTFDDVIQRLPAIHAMGFDTLYFPPIHPIGRRNRKGRNNSLTAQPGEPGSPYAIGSREGGHEAIHPELGTWDDLRRLRYEAAMLGMELALDFAIQCAPDHPWLEEHPEWFDWRPDGSIRYAENPPKKYQDIVNVDFYAEQAVPDLWIALRDLLLLWAEQGIRAFRVDNPHTKPLPFWEWAISEVQARYPDVIFLSEAFTHPKMMNRLAKIGFTQSYTYFTWRNTKQELTEYLLTLNSPEQREFFRPHFFANTPDIHPRYLQHSGRPGFLVRAVLAATLSGLWGISSGFELCEAAALPDSEEFLNSEKYEIRAWDWQQPGNIIEEISALNRLRRQYPSLQTHLGVSFHPFSNDQVIFYSKADPHDSPPLRRLIVIAVNLDPHHVQQGTMELPLHLLGLGDHDQVAVEDLLHGYRFDWHGKWQQLRMDPQEMPYAIWQIQVKEQ
ncbi:alpha-1,4-glucan--maltose-1-phosphate maltosyltransferase [Methylobacillus caricis]|uniref:alpha-1,4-glucan--maltose-1-phosphate maltosyltransferase n=1 Tax=Methylobacillus caricis TaxID=1971611 RepID=UPI001CFFBC88|nr:alpha-1,4-glucan--maltose-1-phosphate maltosyltransferase [Methylobacillus caricis]MCB5186748.1 alpha-1,4-glucan--maltose-1-phosphate maltosyltransferase [Methylobacillus caricis]